MSSSDKNVLGNRKLGGHLLVDSLRTHGVDMVLVFLERVI